MIGLLKGNFIYKTPAALMIDVNGVGYEVQISLNTYTEINNAEQGQLYTYLHISDNAQVLYGFFKREEKELFLQLISVSGVGASTARMMLSGMKPQDITKAILQNNSKLLESIKGIGRKTAERIIVELRDKVTKNVFEGEPILNNKMNSNEYDAINALVALGISKTAAEASVKKLNVSENEQMKLEEIIKLALKNI